MATLPKLRSDLIISPSTQDNATVYTIKEARAGKYIRLREPEYWLISQFDGVNSPENLAAQFETKYGFAMSAAQVSEFSGMLTSLGFVESGLTEQLSSRYGYGAAPKRTITERILFMKLGVLKPGNFLTRLSYLYRPFHRPFWFALELLIMAVGLALLASHRADFSINLATRVSVASIATIVLSLFVFITIHELAHAVVCRHYGGEVREMGFLLLYFQPCFYADVSDAWLFPKKSHRLAVTLAGLWSQAVLMSIAIVIWRVTVDGSFINSFARTVGAVCWITFLFNFNPLIKLDGYYLLSDWLDIANLRAKAFGYLKNVFQRRLLGWPVQQISVSPREQRIFLSYALLALTFSTFLLGYVAWTVGKFLTGQAGLAGLVLLIALLAVILRPVILNLGKGTVQHFIYMKSLLKKPLRLASYVIVFVAVFLFVIAVPFPHRVSGDVLIQPISEFSVALNEYGLLESSLRTGGASPESKSDFVQMMSNEATALQLSPRVRDGQQVVVGDTVAVLLSNQISQQIAMAEGELERLSDQLKLLKAPPKKEQVAEGQAQLNAAKANYDQLKREEDRISELVTKNLISTQSLETARSATEIAKAEMNNKISALALVKSGPRPEEEAVIQRAISKQETEVEYLKRQAAAQVIVTPIAGQVSLRPSDKRLITVTDNESIEVAVPVSDFDISLVEIGQKVNVKVRSFPDRVFEGSVVRIPGAAERIDNGSRFPVNVVVNNPDGALRSGMSGYAKIEAGTAPLATLAWRKAMSVVKVEFWSLW